MRHRRRLLTIAAILGAMACVNFFVFESSPDNPWTLLQIWILVLTILLAAGLAFGKGWARWTTVTLTMLIGARQMLLFLRIVLVTGFDALDWPALLWLVAMGISYLCITCYLIFSSGVAREINRANFLK